MARLLEKVAIVTGAGAGQGKAAAELFAKEGAKVCVADVNESTARQVADGITQSGGEAIAVSVDVSSPVETKALADRAVEAFGQIDVLYNNAGIIRPGSVLSMSLDDWDRTLAVNLTGPFLCCRYVIPYMVAQGSGSIVNTASTSGLIGEMEVAGYGASKGGIISLTRHLAVQHARDNIRVNCICPGVIDTAFNDTWIAAIGGREALDQFIDTFVPAGREGHPEEIARVALFLASEEASLVTGHIMVVDGGFTAQ